MISVEQGMLCDLYCMCFFLVIYITFPVRVTEKLEPIPADFGRDTGYKLSRSPIYYMANTETNNFLHAHSHLWAIYVFSLSEEIHVGTGRACNIHTEKLACWNRDPSCCEAAILPIAPMCHHYYNLLRKKRNVVSLL